MNISYHAEKRISERGIPAFAIDCLLEFGEVEYHQGCEIHRMSKRAEKRMKRYMGQLSGEATKLLKHVYIVTAGEQIVTVARQTKHLKRDR
jgi:hypothetical protein